MWDPTANKVIVNRDVRFAEDHQQGKWDDSISKNNSKTTVVLVENDLEQEDSDSSEVAPGHEEWEPVESEVLKVQRSTREKRLSI